MLESGICGLRENAKGEGPSDMWHKDGGGCGKNRYVHFMNACWKTTSVRIEKGTGKKPKAEGN
jgi:hypothetical protein